MNLGDPDAGSQAPCTPASSSARSVASTSIAPRLETSSSAFSCSFNKTGMKRQLGVADESSGLLNAGAIFNSTSSFVCPKCLKTTPMTEAREKGTQMWCAKDASSYNSLTFRWNKNPKLRKWWHALGPSGQVQWFIKWQQVDQKKRFDFICYVERTLQVHETLEDEVDKFIPYGAYLREKRSEGLQVAQIEAKWKEEVEATRSECILRRGEWLLPRFEGVERRSRQRLSQEQELMRRADVNEPSLMEALWSQGKKALERFSASVQPTLCPTPTPAPYVNVNPSDQPASVQPQDALFGVIAREVSAR